MTILWLEKKYVNKRMMLEIKYKNKVSSKYLNFGMRFELNRQIQRGGLEEDLNGLPMGEPILDLRVFKPLGRLVPEEPLEHVVQVGIIDEVIDEPVIELDFDDHPLESLSTVVERSLVPVLLLRELLSEP